jgi:hypothetical protein
MKRTFIAATAAAALALTPAAAIADSHLGSLQVVTEAVSVPTDGTQVVAVHGVPDEVFTALGADSSEVGVTVDGAEAFTFSYGDTQVVDDLPAGDYEIAVTAGGEPLLGPIDASLAEGVSASIVAHLDADGAPTLAVYVNETDGTGIQVFHTANFGAVDIIAGGDAALSDVTNGVTARIDVPGGTDVEGVGIAPAGGDIAIDLGTVTVPEDTLVLAYAVGQLPADEGDEDGATEDDGTAEDDADEAGTAPTAVHAGSAGLATDALPAWVLGLMGLGALAIAVPAAAAVRTRR